MRRQTKWILLVAGVVCILLTASVLFACIGGRASQFNTAAGTLAMCAASIVALAICFWASEA